MTVYETDGPAATEALGAELAARLRPGDVVHVIGELGAGKTTLVRGACRALGVEAAVTSPTFAIAHRYRARDGLAVAHLDLYRLTSLAAEEDDLLGEYLGPDAIAFIEWPPAAGELPPPRFTVELSHATGERRRVEVRE